MWNLRNKVEDHRGREEKRKQGETREGDKASETLNFRNKLWVSEREVGGRKGWLGDGLWGGKVLW